MLKYNSLVRADVYGRSPVTPWANLCVCEGREDGVERCVLSTCCVPSPLLGVGGEGRGMMWFLSEGRLRCSSGFPGSLSCGAGSGCSSGGHGHVFVNWIRNQLVRELRAELLLVNQQSQELCFCPRRSVNLFFYCRVGEDQLEDRFGIFHFGLSVKNIFSLSAISRCS